MSYFSIIFTLWVASSDTVVAISQVYEVNRLQELLVKKTGEQRAEPLRAPDRRKEAITKYFLFVVVGKPSTFTPIPARYILSAAGVFFIKLLVSGVDTPFAVTEGVMLALSCWERSRTMVYLPSQQFTRNNRAFDFLRG